MQNWLGAPPPFIQVEEMDPVSTRVSSFCIFKQGMMDNVQKLSASNTLYLGFKLQ